MKNLYDQLDVSIYATNEEIKKAFRKKAKIYHPDANNDEKEAEEKFKEIKNAYDTLIDKDKRAEYDFFLKTINEFHNNVDEWDEYFDKKPFNVYKTIRVSQSEANNGITRRIRFDEIGKTFDVVIPKGTVSKQVIKLKNQGKQDGLTKKRGDILITVIVMSNSTKTNGKENAEDTNSTVVDDIYNVYEVVHLNYDQAEDGCTVKVDTPSGKVDVIIPPYTKDGKVIRIKNRGKHDRKNKVYGDLIITVLVANPLVEVYVAAGVVIGILIVFGLVALAFQNAESNKYSNEYGINQINNEQKAEQKSKTTNSSVTNNTTPKKEAVTDPNPYKGFSGGYASNKDGVYNYIKIFPESEIIYTKAYVPVTITFKGYNPDVKFNWQARTSNGEYYHSNYPGEDPDNVHNLSLSFYMPGTYAVDASMGDLIGGWTGRTYTIKVEANPDLKYDVYRDVYYLP